MNNTGITIHSKSTRYSIEDYSKYTATKLGNMLDSGPALNKEI